jgi:hypothetical protein
MQQPLGCCRRGCVAAEHLVVDWCSAEVGMGGYCHRCCVHTPRGTLSDAAVASRLVVTDPNSDLNSYGVPFAALQCACLHMNMQITPIGILVQVQQVVDLDQRWEPARTPCKQHSLHLLHCLNATSQACI